MNLGEMIQSLENRGWSVIHVDINALRTHKVVWTFKNPDYRGQLRYVEESGDRNIEAVHACFLVVARIEGKFGT